MGNLKITIFFLKFQIYIYFLLQFFFEKLTRAKSRLDVIRSESNTSQWIMGRQNTTNSNQVVMETKRTDFS